MNTILRKLGTAALATSLVATGYTLATHTQPANTQHAAIQPARTVCAPAPVRLSVIGDSITSWSPAYAGNKWQSWVYTATSNDMPLVGGWANPGATIAQIEANLTYAESDIFLMMVGTNDLPIMSYGKPGTPVEERFAAMDRMAAKMNATVTVVSSVPPFGWNYYESQKWNQELAAYANSRGFTFIDPWQGARDPNGAWWSGTDLGDRVHPNPSTAGYIGDTIRTALHGLGL